MLMGPTVFKVLLYGLLGIAVLCAVVAGVLAERRTRRAAEPLPEAVIDRPARGTIGKVAPVLGMIAALAAAWQLWRHGIDVIVVGKGPSPVRRVYVGARDHYRAMPHENAEIVAIFRDPTWVVNESGVPLTLITVAYGEHHPEPPVVIPAGSLGAASSINYIGPGDVPPQSIEVRETKEVADLHVTGRTHTWLTWQAP